MTEQNNSKHDELSTQALEAQLRQMPTPQPPAQLKARLLADIPPANPTPRLTYRLPMIRTAAAAAILMVVVGLFAWLTAGNGGASVAFAEAVRQIEEAETLTFTVTFNSIEVEEPTILQFMYMEPGRLRINSSSNIVFPTNVAKGLLPEGSIWIGDFTRRYATDS